MIVIDVTQQIRSVERRVGSHARDGGPARVVTISQTYATDVEDLWDACTNPERIPRWFLPVSGELQLGGRFQLEGNAGGTIEECEPPRRFFATWEFGGNVTWIEVRLAPESSERTRLEIDHIADVDDDTWAQFGPGAVGIGWDGALVGLSLHLGSGRAVDREAGAAWMASEEGRSFVGASSAAWRDANVAGGTPAAEADAAAARVSAAYGAAPAS
jgi:uncharacterized protein YndB with AHSA1/START domain